MDKRIGGQQPLDIKKLQARKNINKSYRIPNDFKSILDESLVEKSKLKISAHAQSRIDQRDLKLEEVDMEKLEAAVDRLDKKGSRESLMFYKDMAFIASIKNRTIITALEREDLDLITNIDSTIIIK